MTVDYKQCSHPYSQRRDHRSEDAFCCRPPPPVSYQILHRGSLLWALFGDY
ncbi:MAG TPA: hypothetical protein VKB68_12290 [Stellaceae bacterium]|nr:hypothetical protein [Stellaceae bacterium]